jgi:hypothetical protein
MKYGLLSVFGIAHGHRQELFVSLSTVEGRPLIGHLVKMRN